MEAFAAAVATSAGGVAGDAALGERTGDRDDATPIVSVGGFEAGDFAARGGALVVGAGARAILLVPPDDHRRVSSTVRGDDARRDAVVAAGDGARAAGRERSRGFVRNASI